MSLSALGVMNNVADGASLYQRGITSATVIITGFVVVFAVLILLIFIITIYGKIVYSAQNRGKNKKASVSEKAKAVADEPARTEVMRQGAVPDETIAVISAAVAAVYGSDGRVEIKSIKKSDGGRSAWASAGVMNNTRPF